MNRPFRVLGVVAGIAAMLVTARSFLPEAAYAVHADTHYDPKEQLRNFPLAPPKNENAVCLSGGGYRAALFDVGVLWRLNELGVLGHTSRVSGVSGGSITAAVLIQHWSTLYPGSADGVANNSQFEGQIAAPILRLTAHRIDLPSMVKRLFSLQPAAHYVAAGYDEFLFQRATLDSLPKPPAAPELSINSTQLENGNLWRFSQNGLASPEWPTLDSSLHDDRQLPIALAVAASSAFPPFLAPLNIDVRELVRYDVPLKQDKYYRDASGKLDSDAAKMQSFAREKFDRLARNISLVDGGALNNLGSQDCYSGGLTIIADASIPSPASKAGNSWFQTIYRVMNLMYSAKENVIRESAVEKGMMNNDDRPFVLSTIDVSLTRTEGLWRYSSLKKRLQAMLATESFEASDRNQLTARWTDASTSAEAVAARPTRAFLLASIPTELNSLHVEDQQHLINMGYIVCDYAIVNEFVRSREWITQLPPPLRRRIAIPDYVPKFLSATIRLPYPVHHCLSDEHLKGCPILNSH